MSADNDDEEIGADTPPPSLAEAEMTPTSLLLGLRSRMGYEQETFVLRVLSMIELAIIVALLLSLFIFFGFTDMTERLFVLSMPHVLLSMVVFAASIRFGVVAMLALMLAALQVMLDGVELALRIVLLSLTIKGLVFILINLALLVLSIILTSTLWRIRTVVQEQNARAKRAIEGMDSRQVGDLRRHAQERLLQQESNTIRTAAITSVVAVFILLVFIAVTAPLNSTAEILSLFSGVHLLLAIYSVVAGLRGGFSSVVLIAFALAVLAVDCVELVLRLFDNGNGLVFGQVNFDAIVAILLLFINIGFLYLDVAWTLTSIGYYYAYSGVVENSIVLEEVVTVMPSGAHVDKINAFVVKSTPVRRRK